MRRPLFICLLAFIFGVSLFYFFLNYSNYIEIMTDNISLYIIVIFILFIILFLYFYKYNNISMMWLITVLTIVGFMYGLIRYDLDEQIVNYIDREQVVVTGTVSNSWETPDYQALIVKTDKNEKYRVQIYKNDNKENDTNENDNKENSIKKISIKENSIKDSNVKEENILSSISPGTIISLTGEYRKPVTKRNVGGFDEERYYWLNNWDGKIGTTIEQITLIGKNNSINYQLAKLLYNFKSYNQKLIKTATNDREYAVINALVLGDRAFMDYDTKELIKLLGLSHLFALSGLHVGIIIAIIILILDNLSITREKTYTILLVILPIYALIVGGTPSITRAVIMAELTIIAMLINRNSDVYINLMVAAFIIILLEPKNLLSVGFQLTFFITYGIILFEPIMNSLLLKINLTWNWLRKLLSISLSAQIFAFPLLVFYFREFAWFVLISQFFILQIISIFILPMGVLLLFIAWIHPALSVIPVYILHLAAKSMLFITDKMSFATSYVTIFSDTNLVWVVFYFFSVLCLAYLINYKPYKKTKIYSCLVIILILIGSLWLPKLPSGDLHITIIDVGQGDAIHIETPKGKNILIDAGGYPKYNNFNFDTGQRIIVPYFQAKGIKQIDLIMASHSDYDHIGGLETIINNFTIKRFMYGVNDMKETFNNLIEVVSANGIELYQVSKGDKIEIEDGLVLDILHPNTTKFTGESANNYSIVALLKYKTRTVLLTGDIEQPIEQKLIDEIKNKQKAANESGLYNIDILKVAHHGSITSTTQDFLNITRPKYALISVGNNRFGHPNELIIDRLSDICEAIYRTDKHGAISIKIDKNENISFKTMLKLE